MKHAYAYLRQSKPDLDVGDSFDRQADTINRFVDCRGDIDRVCFYREKGVSGTLEDRPAFGAMLADFLESDVDTLVVASLDRLARDVIVQEQLIRHLQARKITLLSCAVGEQDLCDNDPTRKFIRLVLGAAAALERDLMVLRTRVARDRIRHRGERCEGRKPYGSHPRKPFEQEVLARITIMAADGYTWTSIARELNEAKIPTRSGGEWFPSTVGRILRRLP
jgi:DNA invertase Pin-like site-specific DNA recombinase